MDSASTDSLLAGFPAPLRQLIDAELAAGNAIVELSSTFPAPPAGACARLAHPVRSRPRESGQGLVFYDRNSSIYSGEWTDAKRFHFVIEPPLPPPPEVDMDAIRAGLNRPASVRPTVPPPAPPPLAREPEIEREAAPPTPSTPLERFEASMVIDYEKWHDGIGYDLDALRSSRGGERRAIETVLVARGARDWRDVEALAVLDSERAREVLRRALKDGSAEIRGAVLRYAPKLGSEDERTAALVSALETADFFGGLSAALDVATGFHPPAVIDALFQGALHRKGDVACHFAAMLMYLHGRARAPFDDSQRPFFLRFNTPDRAARRAVFLELGAKLRVDVQRYLE